MFPGQRFGAPFFVEYGQDQSGAADGGEEYAYAISNDGFWNNGNTMILGRVPRKKMPLLNASDWEFYVGGGADGRDAANWTPNIYAPCNVGMLKATHILRSPEKLSMTSATYNRALGCYIMPCWHYEDLVPYDTNGQLCKFQRTEWELYQAPAPWGPWTKFASFSFAPEGYYNPCIVSKLISADGLRCTVFTGGTFSTAGMQGHDCLYRLTTLQMELIV
jgi:hypothetical protein